MKIVYAGTPRFAVAPLKKIIGEAINGFVWAASCTSFQIISEVRALPPGELTRNTIALNYLYLPASRVPQTQSLQALWLLCNSAVYSLKEWLA